MTFEWDDEKERVNLEKHGVSFDEAKTAFDDPLYIDFYDPAHSYDEHRYIIIGESGRGRLLLVSYTERGEAYRLISSSPPSGKFMKKVDSELEDELRPEYDLRGLRVRGMGPGRKKFGDVVRLEPDVAEAFPDAAAVNEALRFLIRITKENRPDSEPREAATG